MTTKMSIKEKLKYYLKELIYKRKIILTIFMIFTLFCIVSTIVLLVNSRYQNALYAILTLLIVLALIFVEIALQIRVPVILLVLLLLIPMGALLGNSFNLYTILPWFDDLLHTISGFIFACIGFSLAQIFIGEVNTIKKFIGCLIMGFVFSLAIGLIWEMIEYAGTVFLKIDMQDDSIVNEINSFLLAGNHYEMVKINDITKTIIYYQNGEIFTIDGYLDIGLKDTLFDMFVCLIGAILYLILLITGYRKSKKIFKLFCPEIIVKEDNIC